MGKRVAVRYRDVIETAVISTGTPPTARLRDNVEREAQGLFDRRVMPRRSRVSNSDRAISRVEARDPSIDRRASGRHIQPQKSNLHPYPTGKMIDKPLLIGTVHWADDRPALLIGTVHCTNHQ